MSGIPNVQFGQTPPTEPGALPPEQTKWPTVFGIISIVFGAGGAFCNFAGVFMVIFQDRFLRMMMGALPPAEAEKQIAAAQAAQPPAGIAMVVTGFAMLTSILLLVAGITCLRRRTVTRSLHMGWAVARTLVAIGVLVMQLMAHARSQEFYASSGMTNPQGQYADVIMYITVALTLLWSIAYPLVVVIWFNRAVIKREMAEWHRHDNLGGV